MTGWWRSKALSSFLVGALFWIMSGFSAAAVAEPEAILLQVGDFEVSAEAFSQLAARESRRRFYHFTPPEGEREAFYRELVDELIDQELLAHEADRRGVVPDGDYVVQRLVAAERRFQGEPEQWAEMVPKIKADLDARASILALQEAVESAVTVAEEEVREFYASNLSLFEQPPQYRVGLILKAVAPWEGSAAWQAAEQEAAALVEALRQGGDFGELAEEVSDDPTAANGGDMGYLHEGMLGNEIQETVVSLAKVGQVSDPVRVLEGVAIVKLLDKKEAQQMSFGSVEARARGLLLRERREAAWAELKQRLRDEADIEFNEALFAQLLKE
ncbi:peptidylprolyl isomerase [Motiliproteus sp. SC1-56]|uniref:peptidylprolyl isomerase n=1 Tax=Motiliproteus sp. SC1-56 TaxID=2799565 RepID=UPI001A8F3926|nr:peptidylprolyl isomerase [Motiliproteus sp. SC1-56]